MPKPAARLSHEACSRNTRVTRKPGDGSSFGLNCRQAYERALLSLGTTRPYGVRAFLSRDQHRAQAARAGDAPTSAALIRLARAQASAKVRRARAAVTAEETAAHNVAYSSLFCTATNCTHTAHICCPGMLRRVWRTAAPAAAEARALAWVSWRPSARPSGTVARTAWPGACAHARAFFSGALPGLPPQQVTRAGGRHICTACAAAGPPALATLHLRPWTVTPES